MSDSLNVNNDLRKLVRYNLQRLSTDSIDDPRSPAGYTDYAISIGLEKGIRAGSTIFSKENRERYKATRQGLNGYKDFRRIDEIDDAFKRQLNAKIEYLKSKNLPQNQLEKALEGVKQKHVKNVQKMLTQTQNLSSKELAQKLDDVEKITRQFDLDAHKNNMLNRANHKPTTFRGKLADKFKTYTGYKKARQVADSGKAIAKETIMNSSKLRKTLTGVSKFAKSNALTAVAADALIVGGMEVYDTYQNLGADAAKKQAVREVKNTGAKIVGYAAGAKAGALIGAPVGALASAKLGALCGSWAGPIGAGIGAVIGLACGLAGAYLAGLGAEAAFGKSEIEQFAEKQAEECANNKEVFKQLTDITNLNKIRKESIGDSTNISSSYQRVLGAYLRGEICKSNPQTTLAQN